MPQMFVGISDEVELQSIESGIMPILYDADDRAIYPSTRKLAELFTLADLELLWDGVQL